MVLVDWEVWFVLLAEDLFGSARWRFGFVLVASTGRDEASDALVLIKVGDNRRFDGVFGRSVALNGINAEGLALGGSSVALVGVLPQSAKGAPPATNLHTPPPRAKVRQAK